MIPTAQRCRVWLATGPTDMRKGSDGLEMIVQETLKRHKHSGHLFVFRGRCGALGVSEFKRIGALASIKSAGDRLEKAWRRVKQSNCCLPAPHDAQSLPSHGAGQV